MSSASSVVSISVHKLVIIFTFDKLVLTRFAGYTDI